MKVYTSLRFRCLFIILSSILGLDMQAQNVFISGKVENIKSSQLICYRKPNSIFSFMPLNRIQLIPLNSDGSFSIKTEIYTPEEWLISYETTNIALFVQPNEKMEIRIYADETSKYSFIIKGLHTKEQNLKQKMYNIQKEQENAPLSTQDSLFLPYSSWDKIEFDYTEIDDLDSTFLKFYETNSSYFRLYAKIRDKKIKADSLFLHDNEAALYSPHYNACIMAYLQQKDTTGLQFSALALRSPLILRFELAQKALSGKVRDAALSQIVATALNEGNWVGDTLYLRYQKSVYSIEFRWMLRTFVADYFRQILAQKGQKIQFMEKEYGKQWQKIFVQHPQQLLYIDIWQDNCRPCIYEMEQSLFWQKQREYDSLAFIFIYLGKNKKHWKELVKKYNISGKHYIIRNSKAIEKWMTQAKGNAALPHYLIIGKNGEILVPNAPFPDGEKWKDVIDAYLK